MATPERPDNLPRYAKDKTEDEIGLPEANSEQLQKEGYKAGDIPEHTEINAYFLRIYLWLRYLEDKGLSVEAFSEKFHYYYPNDNYPFVSDGEGDKITVYTYDSNDETQKIELTYLGQKSSAPANPDKNDVYLTDGGDLKIYEENNWTSFIIGDYTIGLGSKVNKKINNAIDFLRGKLNEDFSDYIADQGSGEYSFTDIENPDFNDILDKKVSDGLEKQAAWQEDNQLGELERNLKLVDPEGDYGDFSIVNDLDVTGEPIKPFLLQGYTSTNHVKYNDTVRDGNSQSIKAGQDDDRCIIYAQCMGMTAQVFMTGGVLDFDMINYNPESDNGYFDIDLSFKVPDFLKPAGYPPGMSSQTTDSWDSDPSLATNQFMVKGGSLVIEAYGNPFDKSYHNHGNSLGVHCLDLVWFFNEGDNTFSAKVIIPYGFKFVNYDDDTNDFAQWLACKQFISNIPYHWTNEKVSAPDGDAYYRPWLETGLVGSDYNRFHFRGLHFAYPVNPLRTEYYTPKKFKNRDGLT